MGFVTAVSGHRVRPGPAGETITGTQLATTFARGGVGLAVIGASGAWIAIGLAVAAWFLALVVWAGESCPNCRQ